MAVVVAAGADCSGRRRSSIVIEPEPVGVKWRTKEETQYLLSLMSDVNRAKLKAAQRAGRRVVGTVYRRTRPDENGVKRQRAEVRFDDVAGCLRTPAGGSSRQTILVVEGRSVRSRLLSPREAARLMGLPEDYRLPERYNDAYHVCGDGVAVPIVRFLARRCWSRSSPATGRSASRRSEPWPSIWRSAATRCASSPIRSAATRCAIWIACRFTSGSRSTASGRGSIGI